MLKLIKNRLLQENFNPSWLGIFTNPFFITRKSLYEKIKKIAPELSGKILDVGCGRKPYKNLFSYEEYVGIDVEQEGHNHQDEDIDVFFDGKNIPFPENHFDSVICSEVLEHVFHPQDFLAEINRVLKPGGRLLITVPFVWDEHEQPYDYGRYSSFGLTHLLNGNKFEIVRFEKSVNNVGAVFQLLNAYIFKVACTKNKFIRRLITLTLISHISMLGLCLSKITPKNDDLYLNNVCLCKKTK